MVEKLGSTNISIIETKVAEETSLQAEALYDENAVSLPKPLKNNTWECTVIDNSIHYSTSITVINELLKNYKCNCNLSIHKEICRHVVASVIQFRNTVQEENIKIKTPKRSEPARRVQQDISFIIKQLPKEELVNFIIAKSKSDNNFRLLVQARFIEYLPKKSLESFIESTYPVLTKANEKISPSKLNIFIEISKELKIYLKSLITQDNLIEAYKLAYLHLKKSFYIKHYLKNEHSRFIILHNELLANFLEIFKLIEAPEYKEGILEQLEDLLSSSYISASISNERNLWLLLMKDHKSKKRINLLSSEYLSKSKHEDYETFYFLRMLEIISQKDQASMQKIISDKNAQETYRIIHLLGDHLNIPEANKALQIFYTTKSLNHPLSKFILNNVHVEKNFTDIIISKSLNYFILFKDTIYISFIKKICTSWVSAKKEIIEMAKSEGDVTLLIDVYFTLGIEKKGLKLLQENISWGLLTKFDKKLIESNEEKCYQLYQLVLSSYLKDHFGKHSKEFIKEVFYRIKFLERGQWISPLQSFIKKEFPERNIKV